MATTSRRRYLESPDGRFVHLPGGLALPYAPVALCLDLESRGFRLRTDGVDIIVTPPGRLTPEDKAALRSWKPHVVSLLAYIDRQEAQ